VNHPNLVYAQEARARLGSNWASTHLQ
jgi:hypothetical protein